MGKQLTAIDLFSGIGGFTEGATQAGVKVLMAANHWDMAVDFHKKNHPEVEHHVQDLRLIDWNKVPDHDIMLASPCCQGHSLARGRDKAKSDPSRQTAWCVVDGLQYKRPKYFIMENVVEFLSWELFEAWNMAVEGLGYRVTYNRLDSSEFGVPQKRVRLYIVGQKTKALDYIPIQSPRLDPIAAGTIIDWEFGGRWKPTRTYGPLVRRQLDPARELYGDQFLVAYYSSEKKGRNPWKPLGTLTTSNHFLVVKYDKARPLSVEEYRKGMGFPEHYVLPKQRTHALKMLGNAVCPPVIKEILKQIQERA